MHRDDVDWELVRTVLALMGLGLLLGAAITLAGRMASWWRW
jgi:hypothetical protein